MLSATQRLYIQTKEEDIDKVLTKQVMENTLKQKLRQLASGDDLSAEEKHNLDLYKREKENEKKKTAVFFNAEEQLGLKNYKAQIEHNIKRSLDDYKRQIKCGIKRNALEAMADFYRLLDLPAKEQREIFDENRELTEAFVFAVQFLYNYTLLFYQVLDEKDEAAIADHNLALLLKRAHPPKRYANFEKELVINKIDYNRAEFYKNWEYRDHLKRTLKSKKYGKVELPKITNHTEEELRKDTEKALKNKSPNTWGA